MFLKKTEYAYLLLHILDYHGGTRGSELGIYKTKKLAMDAWKLYKKEEMNRDIKGKIVKIKMNDKPETWCGSSNFYL